MPAPSPSPGVVPALNAPSNGDLFTFYMYRAVGSNTYPPQNVNTGNLAGVLWYINNEVVSVTPRKFGITKIIRLVVHTRATAPLLAKGMNFGVRFAFDGGKCTGPYDCAEAFRRYGYFVGCNKLGEFPFPYTPVHYPDAVWYSLPGDCPLRPAGQKDDVCRASEKGGACTGIPTGTGTCTYSYSSAGEITLAELEAGQGNTYWSGLNDDGSCARRLEDARKLFAIKYPGSPTDSALQAPSCDFDRSHFYT